jgi:hypothetical protein
MQHVCAGCLSSFDGLTTLLFNCKFNYLVDQPIYRILCFGNRRGVTQSAVLSQCRDAALDKILHFAGTFRAELKSATPRSPLG